MDFYSDSSNQVYTEGIKFVIKGFQVNTQGIKFRGSSHRIQGFHFSRSKRSNNYLMCQVVEPMGRTPSPFPPARPVKGKGSVDVSPVTFPAGFLSQAVKTYLIIVANQPPPAGVLVPEDDAEGLLLQVS